jgi:hypothetical protein
LEPENFHSWVKVWEKESAVLRKRLNAQKNKATGCGTEIRPGEFKGPAFRKGHTVCNQDLCHLQKLGKNHLYLLDLQDDEIHEDQAAAIPTVLLAKDDKSSIFPVNQCKKSLCRSGVAFLFLIVPQDFS